MDAWGKWEKFFVRNEKMVFINIANCYKIVFANIVYKQCLTPF